MLQRTIRTMSTSGAVTATVKPDPELSARYEAQYQKFRQIYPAMKELFPALNA